MLCILAAWASPLPADSPWPMFRHDLRHTGRTPFTGPASPIVQWVYTAGDGIASSASIGHDGTIYMGVGWNFVGSPAPGFLALHRDGSLKWFMPTDKGIFSSPAIGSDGTIYFGSLDRHVYAVEDSITHPRVRWRTSLGHWIYSSPALGNDETVYVGALTSKFYALDLSGQIKWTHQTYWCIFSSAAIGPDGLIYIGSKDHTLYAFEDHTTEGTVHWQYSTGEFFDGHCIDSSPAIGPDGTVYVGTDPYGASGYNPVPVTTVFFAVNPDGSHKWSFDMEDGTESSPAIGPDGTIYIGSYDGYLYSIEDQGDRGVLKWKFKTGGWIDGSPVVDGCGTIYVGSRDSTLYALNPDGSLRWSFPTGGEIEASPTIDDRGILYIGNFSGDFFAIGSGGSDMGIVALVPPEEPKANDVYVPSASVRNYRLGFQTVDVYCHIDTSGYMIYEDSLSVSDLAETTTVTVSFTPWTIGADTGTVYRMRIWSFSAEDDNGYNDTLTTRFRISGQGTGISTGQDDPRISGFTLHQSSPNPFNATTSIRYSVISDQTTHHSSPVTLKIFNILGQEIRTLVDDIREPGDFTVLWDGRDTDGDLAPGGIYFYRLQSGSLRETKKMILLK